MTFGGKRKRGLAILGAVVLVVGLIVGYAHLRLHRLQTADVVWSAPAIRGDTAVASGRIYTYDPNDGLRINRFSDGKQVADKSVGGLWMYLGRSGYFAVLDLNQMSFYSPTGKKLWTRQQRGDTSQLFAKPQAIGDGTITFQDCKSKTSCALVNLDTTGATVWRNPLPAGVSGFAEHFEDVDQPATRNDRRNLDLVPSVSVQNRDGRLTALDQKGAPYGESIQAEASTIVDDQMIEISHRGEDCTYRAVRDGTEQWTSSAACPGDSKFDHEPLYVLALANRLYATYSATSGSRMVSLDLKTGRATSFNYIYTSSNRTSAKFVYAGEAIIVKQDKRKLTGISPATGKVLWRYTDHGDTKLYPAVAVTGGTVNIQTAPRKVWRTLAVGHTYPLHSITILDAKSGKTTAHFMHESIYGPTAAPDGATLVIADDQMFLVGKR